MFTAERVPSAHVLLNMLEKGLSPACAVQHTCFILFWTDQVKKDGLIGIAAHNQKCYLGV